jgi:hypothetical protein
MTTFQIVCFIFIAISGIGVLFSIWLTVNDYNEGPFFMLISSLILIAFGISGAISFFSQHQSGFEEKRDIVLSVISNKFNAVCDHAGVDTGSAARPNCIEKQGFRAWRENGKLYVASVIGDNALIDLIVKEDELLSGKSYSIVYWSDKLDQRRLSYAFSPYGSSAYE